MNKTENLQQWSQKDVCLIDLRSEEEHLKRRLISSKTLSLPIESLHQRLFELPPKNELSDAHDPKNFLVSRGWNVEFEFISTPDFWNIATKYNLVDEKAISNPQKVILYHPCPLLSDSIHIIEQSLQNIPYWRAIDIGCGSGRDVAFLCSRDKRWNVVAVDCKRNSLDRVLQLCEKLGVSSHQVNTVVAKIMSDGSIKNLEQYSSTTAWDQKYNLIICVRFLQRGFLPKLADMVEEGGFVLYLTFVEDNENEDKRYPKNPQRILKAGELATFFTGKQFEIITDKIETIDDGRLANFFLAKKSNVNNP